MTRRSIRRSTCLVNTFEPKRVSDALENEDWISTMNEEIEQIERKNLVFGVETKRQECNRNKMGI